jgi:hypothetical protein
MFEDAARTKLSRTSPFRPSAGIILYSIARAELSHPCAGIDDALRSVDLISSHAERQGVALSP